MNEYTDSPQKVETSGLMNLGFVSEWVYYREIYKPRYW